MPYIDMNAYNNAEAKQGGGAGIEQMKPGVYELMIQAVRTQWTKKDGSVTDGIAKSCVMFVWDVASGDFAWKYSDPYFMDWDGKPDPEKDFMHNEYVSWSNLDYLKGKFEVLKACNPGFDPLAAFQADQWDMFVGKRFFAVLDGTLTLNKKGYENWLLEVGDWLTPEQARTGDHREPNITDERKKAPQGGGGGAPRPAALGGGNLNV